MRIRPCIDLHAGKVKQIVGSSLENVSGSKPLQTNFSTEKSAAEFAALYRRDGLKDGHLIMLGTGNQEQARAALHAYPGGLQIGGGINPDNARTWLDEGAAKVIVTSYLFVNGEFDRSGLVRMAEAAGPERLVVDLSCRRQDEEYFVASQRWKTTTNLELTEKNLEELARSCREFLIHSVDVEGKREGIDEPLVALLAKICPVVTTYAGGIRSLEDLEKIRELGRNRIDATVGSALDIFGGSLPYREVVRFNQGW